MQIYKEQNITLAAGADTSRSGLFRFISVLENSGTGDVSVAFGRDGEYYEIPKGLSVELPSEGEQNFVRFQNNTAAAMTIRVAFTAGRIFDNRLILDASTPLPIDKTGDPLPVSIDQTDGPLSVSNELPNYANQVTKSSTSSGTIHEVSAGKTLYLYGFSMDAPSTGSRKLYVTDDSDVEQYFLFSTGASSQSFVAVGLKRPIAIPEGWKVVFSGNNTAFIYGEEI